MAPTVLGGFRRISANFGSPRTISYQIMGHGSHALKNLDPGVGARFRRMSRICCLLKFGCNFAAQFMQGIFTELHTCNTEVVGVLCRRTSVIEQTKVDDAGDGKLARGLFAITQNLAEKRPQNDSGAVDTAWCE